MADKKKSSSSKESFAKETTRVVASTTSSKKTSKKTVPAANKAAVKKATPTKDTADKPKKKRTKKQKGDGYFKGAWHELRQVRWPNRSATWKLTFAVLVYSAFFFLLVIALDAVFKYFFDLLIQ